MKRTKIICTIGPATESVEKIKQLSGAGMNVARLNFSHGSYYHHRELVRHIRQVAKTTGQPIAILQDLQGPRIRLGELPKDGIAVKRGDVVALVDEGDLKHFTKEKGIIVLPTQIPLSEIVKKGETILIKDGLVQLKAKKVSRIAVIAEVEQGDVLTTHRGINLPESALPRVVITRKDKEDVKFGLKQQVDWIALSFVRSGHDIQALRKLFPRFGSYRPRIVAKIERKEAVDNFEEILKEADAVMIARGDLGIELPAQDIPLIQKRLIRECLAAAKPVIVATQMLESMIVNPRPTRAEVSDIANAVLDGADALMLSAETATGKFPVAACQIMRDTIMKAEASPFDETPVELVEKIDAVPHLIAHTIGQMTKMDHVKVIVVMSSSGRSAQLVAAERPEAPIMALTQHEITRRQMSLVWGVKSYLMRRYKNVDDLIVASIRLAKRELKAEHGDKIIIASGHPTGPHGHLNLVKIHKV